MTTSGPFGPESLERAASHVAAARAPDALGRPVVAPHALDTNDEATLETLRAMAETTAAPLHLHLAQSLRERATIDDRVGCSSVEYARRLGLLDQPSVLAHCSHLDPGDVNILAAGSAAVAVYCPTVHAIDATVQPATTITERGGVVAIGTDATPNERYSVMHEAGAAVVSQHQEGLSWTPRQSLSAATSALTATLDVEALGTLCAGAPADLVVWHGSDPHLTLADDPVIALVMAPPRVHSTIVAGRVVVSNGVLQSGSLDEIRSSAVEAKNSLFARAELS